MTIAHLAALAVLGLAVGSFLNVCISRVPAGESIVRPASRCPSCREPIGWLDNIPLVSYAALLGRCRHCRSPISLRYPAVELATSIAFLLQGVAHGSDLPLLVSRLVFTALLLVLFGTDLETERLPNVFTIPGTAAGVIFSLTGPPGFRDSVVGVLVGGGVLFAIRWAWHRATGVEGMGLGDVKMLAMIGAFLGWRQVMFVLFLSSIAGAIVGLFLIAARGRTMRAHLPFGTLLAVAAFVASLVGDAVLTWYVATLG